MKYFIKIGPPVKKRHALLCRCHASARALSMCLNPAIIYIKKIHIGAAQNCERTQITRELMGCGDKILKKQAPARK